jgi:hypothetical protein
MAQIERIACECDARAPYPNQHRPAGSRRRRREALRRIDRLVEKLDSALYGQRDGHPRRFVGCGSEWRRGLHLRSQL